MGGRGVRIGVAIAVVGALLLGVALALRDDGDDVAADETSETIRLEPIGSSFPGDFAGDLDLRAAGAGVALALPGVPPLGAGVGGALAGVAVDGDRPGLYGGSRDLATCDVEQLVDFLTDPANRAEAAAWAGVHGIDVDEIAAFVDGLTPVRLRYDTRVTNHGFRDGRATPVQSVLQAGTAVLVDDRGVPRAKCACGNPLLEPETVPDPVPSGDEWEGFDPEEVAAIEPTGGAVESFVLVDVDDGTLFERPVGTDGEADVVVPPDPELCATFAESPTCAESPAATAVVPDVTGSSVSAARRALAGRGFVGPVTERTEPAEGVGAGVVLGTEPAAGTDVPLDTPIVLVVSAGDAATTSTSAPRTTSTSTSSTSSTSSSTTTTSEPEPEPVIVPDVVGMPEQEAAAQIRAAGLVPARRSDPTPPPSVQPGTVVAQDPAAGTPVPPGSTVTIDVAEPVILE